MKLKVNPPIALESTELYQLIRYHEGVSTTSESTQTFTIKVKSLDEVLIISLKSKTGDSGCWLLVGVGYYATIISQGSHFSMPTVSVSGSAASGITFTWSSTETYNCSCVEISHKW